jgi:hypothetical protein
MSDTNQNFDLPPGIKEPIPTGINVLTILTFIGCGIAFIGTCWQLAFAKKGLDAMEQMINSSKYDEMPSMLKKMYSPEALEVARKQYENRIPLALIGIVALVLCVLGAMQMRKLRMQGYYLYLIGEFLPIVGLLIFVGIGAISGFGILIVVFALLFAILYTAQRKQLVNQ